MFSDDFICIPIGSGNNFNDITDDKLVSQVMIILL